MSSVQFSSSIQFCPTLCGLAESQGGIRIAKIKINNLRYADDTTTMAESEEEIKSLLMRVKEENEKPGLKLKIQKIQLSKTLKN